MQFPSNLCSHNIAAADWLQTLLLRSNAVRERRVVKRQSSKRSTRDSFRPKQTVQSALRQGCGGRFALAQSIRKISHVVEALRWTSWVLSPESKLSVSEQGRPQTRQTGELVGVGPRKERQKCNTRRLHPIPAVLGPRTCSSNMLCWGYSVCGDYYGCIFKRPEKKILPEASNKMNVLPWVRYYNMPCHHGEKLPQYADLSKEPTRGAWL